MIDELPMPLYVGGHASVVLDDGPSLVVAAPAHHPLRVPLARCSRLVLRLSTNVGDGVLAACVRQRIPVFWLNGAGQAYACCLPCAPEAQKDTEIVREALARADWKEAYDAWKLAQRRLALLALARRFGFDIAGWRNHAWLCSLMHRCGIRRAWGLWAIGQWRGLLVSLIRQHWSDHGKPVAHTYSLQHGWDLAADVASWVALDMIIDLYHRRAHWGRVRAAPRKQVDIALIQALEQRKKRLLKLADDSGRRFNTWLLDFITCP
ncbi:MAG: hypothetical protein D6678_03965 [Zetaproteobacteria bacterium]|nr:MAG: hypothetical protein D6678_03965 [Zetaproteobacteria bacterium]